MLNWRSSIQLSELPYLLLNYQERKLHGVITGLRSFFFFSFRKGCWYCKLQEFWTRKFSSTHCIFFGKETFWIDKSHLVEMLFPVTASDNCKLLTSSSPVSSEFTFFFWIVALLTKDTTAGFQKLNMWVFETCDSAFHNLLFNSVYGLQWLTTFEFQLLPDKKHQLTNVSISSVLPSL